MHFPGRVFLRLERDYALEIGFALANPESSFKFNQRAVEIRSKW